MDINISMTFPPQPPLPPNTKSFPFPPHFPLKSLLQETMYDPRTQSSNTYNHQNLSYGNRGAMNLVDKDREVAQNYENSCSNWYNGVVQFRPNHHQEAMESDHSGVSSPPLWKNSPSPPKSPSHPLLGNHNYRSLSPNTRAQAIARGQWELMEMVKNMPESSYELSLKDLVEHHRIETQAPQAGDGSLKHNQSLHQRAVAKVKRQESKKNDRNVMRSGSFENKGLFLNMVFPFSLKPKKKNKFASNTSGKVSPKPEGLKGGGERDWWKKPFAGSSDSDSSRTIDKSGSSGSTGSSGGSRSSGRSDSGGRKRKGFLTGCWPFFHSRRSKSVE
ncbi:hypothetical protein Pfo_021252 [Paulownia fortunei]|nr:hypothetical protein Pfo_021252 [Paulownia fortunei]